MDLMTNTNFKRKLPVPQEIKKRNAAFKRG